MLQVCWLVFFHPHGMWQPARINHEHRSFSLPSFAGCGKYSHPCVTCSQREKIVAIASPSGQGFIVYTFSHFHASGSPTDIALKHQYPLLAHKFIASCWISWWKDVKKNSSMYFPSFSSILNSEQKWSFGFIGILDNVFDACVKKSCFNHISTP